MNIGIVGYGILGKAVMEGFKDKCEVFINDKEISKEAPKTKKELVLECDYIFICAPTPFNVTKNKCDVEIIDSIIYEINMLSLLKGKRPIVIVKSTVVPSQVRQWVAFYKSIDIVINPEYLTERTSNEDFINQKFMVFGGDIEQCSAVEFLYKHHSSCNKDFKTGFCSHEEASLLKYMANSFLAMYNIFLNEYKFLYDTMNFYDPISCSKDSDENYNNLIRLFQLDERMGVFPFKYEIPGPDKDIGYGGKCLPKDIKSIISEGESVGSKMGLLERVDEINEKIRTNRDWEEIADAISE